MTFIIFSSILLKEGNSRLLGVASTITVVSIECFNRWDAILLLLESFNLSDRDLTHQKVQKNRLTALMAMSQLPLDSQGNFKEFKGSTIPMQLENFQDLGSK